MKKLYNLHYSNKFKKQVYQICDYILEELQNPIASYNFKIKILQTTSVLEYFPYIGQEFQNTHYRYLPMKQWLILYEIQNNSVEIHRIINSKQNFNSSNLN